MSENNNIIPVKIADLITENLQIRVEMNEECIKDYAEIYGESPDKMPPITVYHDGATGKYYLADGFHRVIAAKRAGLETIQATVLEGTFDDALKFALSANDKHGLRRTNADKRNAMEIAWANREKFFGDTVPNVRQFADVCSISTFPAHKFLYNKRLLLNNKQPEIQSHGGDTSSQSVNGELPTVATPDATTVTREHLEERNVSVRKNLKEHKDRYGMEIPERILPAFLSTLPKELLRNAGTLRKMLDVAVAQQDQSCAHFISSATRVLNDFFRIVRQGKPHCVCRMCRGRGCGSCSELGFQTILQYDRNPPEFK